MSLGNNYFFQFCYFNVTVMTWYQKLLNLKILQWRTKILGTVMENLPSTSLTYQMFRCSIMYTSLTTWIPRLALPSPLQTMLG